MSIKPNQHGGRRVGAGRKPGSKTRKQAEAALAAAAAGLTPIDYMLAVMRDEGNEPGIRLDAAKSAAPYIHPRLASLDAKVSGEMSINWPVPPSKLER